MSGLVGLEENHRGAIFITLYQRYDLSLLMLTLITWLTNVVRLLHCKVIFFKPSLPYCTLWKKCCGQLIPKDQGVIFLLFVDGASI